MEDFLIHRGKLTNVYKLGEKFLLIRNIDKIIKYEKILGIIPDKGKFLNLINEFWFKNTIHIIENHLIAAYKNISIVHKCEPFKLEIFVKENIKNPIIILNKKEKNQKKIEISKEEILNKNIINNQDLDFILNKSIKLFNYGKKIFEKNGLILLETKYNFGKDINEKILLIGNIHTPENSKFLIKSSFSPKIIFDLKYQSLDNDCIKLWLKNNYNTDNSKIRNIPDNIIKKSHDIYKKFFHIIQEMEKRKNSLWDLDNNIPKILQDKEFPDFNIIYDSLDIANSSINK